MKDYKIVYVEKYVGSEGYYREEVMIGIATNEEEAKAIARHHEEKYKNHGYPFVVRNGHMVYTVKDFENRWI